jgi:hypothetical protein
MQFSRAAGTTELAQNTTSTSFSQFVGLAGTFYVRVVAITPCGNSTSATVSFTLAQTPGTGPRTPNPPAGTILPLPSYGNGVAASIAAQYRGDLLNSCRDTGGNNVWLFRLLQALRQRDSRWGLNYKRGNRGDLSQDIITYNGTDQPDGAIARIYLVDTISGHCGGNPQPDFNDVSAATWTAGQQGLCSNAWCSLWTIDPFLAGGFAAVRPE